MIEALALAACATLQVETAERGPSALVRVDLPSGAATPVAVLGERVNAIGYSAPQDLVYGVAESGRVVAFDRAGNQRQLPSRHSLPLRAAVAGAVVGERLVVRSGLQLLSVDVDPASANYLRVVRETWLHPEALAVDDFDADPVTGLLHGVASGQHGKAHVVAIDPAGGAVRTVPGTGELPGGPDYGSVALGRDGALYTTSNRHHGRSTLWRVALDGSGAVVRLGSGPEFRTLDSSGCLAAPPVVDPTTTATPTTPPTGTAVVPPGGPGTPSRTSAPAADPTTAPGTAETTAPTTPTTTASSAAPTEASTSSRGRTGLRVPQQRAEAAVPLDHDVRDQRRWGLTALLLIVGAAALGRMATRRR
ncbi:hypothetical protein [Saccharothrix coeruleofusca]|uniref:Uncharacterized protein n=1 Tax=Saccharothrix coeruleofusca TaxID=33919 RepID=A0A918EGD7_9PSEU|nr:hypothetical protein [Saccharothrix coeruleofusca]GGP71123.1 hypothetical protein GCM10010185_50200 [Saccharothrix coeruleofusca]